MGLPQHTLTPHNHPQPPKKGGKNTHLCLPQRNAQHDGHTQIPTQLIASAEIIKQNINGQHACHKQALFGSDVHEHTDVSVQLIIILSLCISVCHCSCLTALHSHLVLSLHAH